MHSWRAHQTATKKIHGRTSARTIAFDTELDIRTKHSRHTDDRVYRLLRRQGAVPHVSRQIAYVERLEIHAAGETERDATEGRKRRAGAGDDVVVVAHAVVLVPCTRRHIAVAAERALVAR